MRQFKNSIAKRVISALFAVLTVFGAAELLVPRAAAANAPLLEMYRSNAVQPVGSVTLTVDGSMKSYPTSVGTVEDLLKVAGVTLGRYDVVRPAKEASLEAGMEVVVLRASVRSETVRETIEHEVSYQPNEYIPRGTENVVEVGADGEREVTYEVISVGGTVVSRRATASVVVTEPVTEVVEYGPGGAILTDDGRVIEWSYKIDGNATAYTTDGYRQKHNALGRIARPGTVAVDPKVIPLKSELYICSRDDVGVQWDYGECVAEDTGGAVKGNIVDLFFNTRSECYAFGRRYCTIYVLG